MVLVRAATFYIYPNEVEVCEGLVLVAVVEAPRVREQGLDLTERHASHTRNEEGTARALLGNVTMDCAVADGHFFNPFSSSSIAFYLLSSFFPYLRHTFSVSLTSSTRKIISLETTWSPCGLLLAACTLPVLQITAGILQFPCPSQVFANNP